MVRSCNTQKIIATMFFLKYSSFLEVQDLSDEAKRGQITVESKKKKREIFEESGHRVDVPPDVSDEKKKALAQKGEDATGSW